MIAQTRRRPWSTEAFRTSRAAQTHRPIHRRCPQGLIQVMKQRPARRAPAKTSARSATANAASCTHVARTAAAAERSCAPSAAVSSSTVPGSAKRHPMRALPAVMPLPAFRSPGRRSMQISLRRPRVGTEVPAARWLVEKVLSCLLVLFDDIPGRLVVGCWTEALLSCGPI